MADDSGVWMVVDIDVENITFDSVSSVSDSDRASTYSTIENTPDNGTSVITTPDNGTSVITTPDNGVSAITTSDNGTSIQSSGTINMNRHNKRRKKTRYFILTDSSYNVLYKIIDDKKVSKVSF